jgi:CheY-like chemotaxis protein
MRQPPVDDPPEPLPAAPSGGDSRNAFATAASILLADDDASFRAALRGVLEEEGYAVTEAADGIETMELLASAADGAVPVPDVVVLDVCMPGYSGLGVLSVMRRFDERPRAIVVTGQSDPSVKDFAQRLGAVHVHTKPVDLDRLLREILAAARGSRTLPTRT